MDRKRIEIDNFFITSSGAKFYKGTDTSEGFYHICDNIRLEAMPEIYKHDVHNYICFDATYIDNPQKHVMQYIKFCPLCGKSLD